jgi:Arc/MetJ family transcription regulator
MRTNIVIDDKLIDRAKELTGLPTKRAVVEEALRLLIRLHEQKQVKSLRGKLKWEGNLDQMREGRFDTTD